MPSASSVCLWSSVRVLYMGNPCKACDPLLRPPHAIHTHTHTHSLSLDSLGIIQQVFALMLYSNYDNLLYIRMYISPRLLNKHSYLFVFKLSKIGGAPKICSRSTPTLKIGVSLTGLLLVTVYKVIFPLLRTRMFLLAYSQI